ncbi:MAG: radical SAM family heme chaperone HemW [Phycisphaerales bacterium]|jgi:oxygen-independent coproporphyrinogen-3 oxidase|nr:radical SAM family heme chaperone HemW [Phycisphaerales bacterium]
MLTQFNNSVLPLQGHSCGFEEQFTAESWLAEANSVNSVYIHVPFCFHKCHYCDFFSTAGSEHLYEAFVQKLAKELEHVGPHLNTVETIFIGGGTPTIFETRLFEDMLHSVETYLPRSTQCEWTVEANPETVTAQKAEAMVRHGVNRVSIGAQSFHPTLLKALERWHDPSSVGKSVDIVRNAGVTDISLDLIYAIPSQTEEQLFRDLHQAVSLAPTHLSCYSLIYEPNTPLRVRLDRGEVSRVNHELEATMFESVKEHLHQEGYLQYEISNFAKLGKECKHNIAYWTNQSWWPFGPSASGHLAGRRWKNTPRIPEYISAGNLPTIVDVEKLDPDKSAGESFMVGLRLVKGMERAWVDELISQSNNRWRENVIKRYVDEGLLHWNNDCLTLTDTGMRFADTVTLALLMEDEEMTDTKERTST